MVNIYGSVNLMAKDQIGCRVLQKLVLETINHVVELPLDPFGNYFVHKLLDACKEEQRTLIVSVLTSKPMELIKICLNNYGSKGSTDAFNRTWLPDQFYSGGSTAVVSELAVGHTDLTQTLAVALVVIISSVSS